MPKSIIGNFQSIIDSGLLINCRSSTDIMLDAFAHLLCNYAGIIDSGLFVSVSDQKFQKKEAIESSIAN